MWSNILGHHRQVEQLKRALEIGRIPNAYLFAGLDGIGKRLVAMTFISALLCEQTPKACGACVPCSKIKGHLHPDVFMIEPKTDRILIEQVRELQQQLQFHALEGKAKVVAVDRADAMTESAANSLLKILEEPPQKTHFILITAFPHRLLPTIRSRCQQILFAPLPEADVKKYLMNRKGFEEKAAQRIAAISQGSIGAVESLDPQFIEDTLGRLQNILVRSNAADIVAAAEMWSKESDRAAIIFDVTMSLYRDLLCYHETYAKQNFICDDGEVLSSIVKKGRSTRQLEKDLAAITRARDALSTTANKQLLFEQLLFTLTN
jgi:DNA polymerase-3 subunit delta'